MKKTSELPQAINNLRAIWEQKKIEMQFTQVEAAKELGWSQGAISHYLNNITALGPSAVIILPVVSGTPLLHVWFISLTKTISPFTMW